LQALTIQRAQTTAGQASRRFAAALQPHAFFLPNRYDSFTVETFIESLCSAPFHNLQPQVLHMMHDLEAGPDTFHITWRLMQGYQRGTFLVLVPSPVKESSLVTAS